MGLGIWASTMGRRMQRLSKKVAGSCCREEGGREGGKEGRMETKGGREGVNGGKAS